MFAETSGSGHGKVGGVTPNQEPGSSEEAAWRPTATSPPTRFICGIGRYIYSYLHPSRETSGAGCPRAPPTSRGRPWWPARARGIQVTDPTQPQDIHTSLPLVRAELLRAAVVVELRGRGAAHQPRLQQVLPGGVGQQQRVPLQHSRPGQWALASTCC